MSRYTTYKNVKIGSNAVIEEGVIIGLPSFNKKDGELQTVIGDNAYIRAHSVIYAGVIIGNNFQTGPNVLIRENNTIGDNVVIWHGATLNPDNKIGTGSRIHAYCFLEMVTLEEKVFLGPNVIFTDDPHPIIPIDFRECWKGATVEDGAIIGGNSTILPHIKIGRNSLVGAGSVVIEDVPENKIAVGNPAKVINDIFNLKCERSGKKHFPYRERKP